MIFNGGKSWGGLIEASRCDTTTGRILIGCRRIDNGAEYCITVSRWISERRAGTITPVRPDERAGHVNMTISSVHSRYAGYRSGEEMAKERFLDRE